MITFKCKMCGGDLHPDENATTCECEYCGSVQTIPTADNEKKGNLFNRANRLRMAAEYDKAAAVYTSITAEFPEEAEAYWGLCLCKYGIEYVEDPVTAKKIPTCHRTRSDSIMDDPDFDQACENADPIAKRVYREEAKAIDRLQRDILSVVANESPYDVFICYKETDDNGERTEDSVLAQDIYDALTAKGLKVFFARITLEDKLGQQYEPYIYAALHSAKVMLSIGTQYEYFDAVWVKNEWARFLDMMKTDKSKTIIPCFKDIDAYDMPREFKNLQAQDMGKLGWLQDLTRGVMKLCGKDEARSQADPMVRQVVQAGNPTVDSLLKRAFVFLEDGAWDSAAEYADKVLDINVENGQAYLVKLLAELKTRTPDQLKAQEKTFEDNEQYKKIQRFGDEKIRTLVNHNLSAVCERIVREILESALTVEEVVSAKKLVMKLPESARNEKLLKACDEKQLQIEALQSEIDRLIKTIEKAETVQTLREKLDSEKQSAEGIRSRLKQNREELSRLHGFFSIARRGSIETEIEEDERKLKTSDGMMDTLRKQLKAISTTGNNAHDIKESRYQLGQVYLKAHLIEKAYRVFKLIPDYKDVKGILAHNPEIEHYIKEVGEKRSLQFAVGKTIQYGRYEQDNDATNGTEVIKWIVLANDGDTATLISKYGLDAKPYNTKRERVTWETCTLRKWLNGEFLNAAFSTEERARLETVTVRADKNPEYSTNPGNDTQDKVYLLSIDEVNRYFASDTDRECMPTKTAAANGAYTDNFGSHWWWLRSPGGSSKCAAYVNNVGSVHDYGYDVYDMDGIVRPVVVMRLS